MLVYSVNNDTVDVIHSAFNNNDNIENAAIQYDIRAGKNQNYSLEMPQVNEYYSMQPNIGLQGAVSNNKSSFFSPYQDQTRGVFS